MVTVLFALIALLGAGALAVDAGLLWAARTQLQNAADAAALAAAANMIDPATPAVTLEAAEEAGIDQAAQNSAVAASSVQIAPDDLTFGHWDLATGVLDPGVDLTDPEQVTGVEVVARLDGVENSRVPALLSRVFGREGFDVTTRATAYLGYAGRVGPGEVDLPIVIDCCKLRGSSCNQDYCETIAASPPNPCALAAPQVGDGLVSCLEFQNTAQQNACWTVFDGDHSSVNSSDLRSLVSTGSSTELSTDESWYLDNGDKTPVIADIRDRFQGTGAFAGHPDGVDRYAPFNGTKDSWVVGFPVVECQTSTHCAAGTSADVVGFVCFEIREVKVTPQKIIRGRFLCPSDPLFAQCDLGPSRTGGDDYGMRAQIPVLVR